MFTKELNDLKVTLDYPTRPKAAPWEVHGINYNVIISRNGEETVTNYWDSQHNAENGIDPDPLNALHCILSDHMVAINSRDWQDVASDFGYEHENEAKRVYNACVRQWKAAQEQLGMTEDEVFSLLDEMQELGY